MSDIDTLLGNGSSIFKTIGLLIAGYIIPIVASKGVNFNGQETQIIQVLGIIIAVALSYVDMKYANSFFKKTITLDDYISYGEKHFNLTRAEDPVEKKDEDEENGA